MEELYTLANGFLDYLSEIPRHYSNFNFSQKLLLPTFYLGATLWALSSNKKVEPQRTRDSKIESKLE